MKEQNFYKLGKFIVLSVLAAALVFLIALTAILLSFGESARIFLGGPFILFIPGFVFTKIFIKTNSILEESVLSFALSIAVVSLTLFSLNLFGFRVSFFVGFMVACFFVLVLVLYFLLTKLIRKFIVPSFLSKYLILPLFSFVLVFALFSALVGSSRALAESIFIEKKSNIQVVKTKTTLFINYSSDKDLEDFLAEIDQDKFNITSKQDKSIAENSIIYYQGSFEVIAGKVSDLTGIEKLKRQQEENLVVILSKDYKKQKLDLNMKIKIENGTNMPGLAAKSREKLKTQGFKFIEIGDAKKGDYKSSTVYYKDKKLKASGEEIIKILDKKDYSLENNPEIQVDILVVLGVNE